MSSVATVERVSPGGVGRKLCLNLDRVAPFPEAAVKVLQLANQGGTRLLDLHKVISTDPALSSDLLRVTNSPLYGIGVRVESTMQAAILLGFERLRQLVLTVGMHLYANMVPPIPELKAIWHHSLATAVIAELLAEGDKSAAYSVGLLHDIGRVAMATNYPQEYSELLRRAKEPPFDLRASERELFGLDHCQAGFSLTRLWNLPPVFLEGTLGHHDDPKLGDSNLLNLIRMSCTLADTLGFGAGERNSLGSYQQLVAAPPYAEHVMLPDSPEELQAQILDRIRSVETT